MYYLGKRGRDLLCRHPAEVRNKGIGFSISQKPLQERQKAGVPRGILQDIQNGKACLPQAGIQGIHQIGLIPGYMKRIKEIKVVRQYVLENNSARTAGEVVGDITDDELKLVIYKEGWTIAAALGTWHSGTSGGFNSCVSWQQKGVQSISHIGDGHTDIINDAFYCLCSSPSPKKSRRFMVSMLLKVDWELEKLPEKLIKDIESTGDRHALNPRIHRQMHLDEIEPFLRAKRDSPVHFPPP